MIIDRFQNEDRKAARELVKEAVHESHVTYTPPSDGTRVTSAALGGATRPDANGNTIRTAFTHLSTTNDPLALTG